MASYQLCRLCSTNSTKEGAPWVPAPSTRARCRSSTSRSTLSAGSCPSSTTSTTASASSTTYSSRVARRATTMSDKPKRRTSVKGHTGVYWHRVAGGRRYEITYIDTEGKRRWKTVDGNLDDAQASRDDLHQRIRKGERVAPTKITVREVAEEWLASQEHRLRPRARERDELALCHVSNGLWIGVMRAAGTRPQHG